MDLAIKMYQINWKEVKGISQIDSDLPADYSKLNRSHIPMRSEYEVIMSRRLRETEDMANAMMTVIKLLEHVRNNIILGDDMVHMPSSSHNNLRGSVGPAHLDRGRLFANLASFVLRQTDEQGFSNCRELIRLLTAMRDSDADGSRVYSYEILDVLNGKSKLL